MEEIIMTHLPQLMTIIALLVFSTSIIVEVLKLFIKRFPTSYVAVIVALVLTLVTYFAYMCATGKTITWYQVVAAIIGGFFVAYISMFGFDKFKEAWEHLKQYKDIK